MESCVIDTYHIFLFLYIIFREYSNSLFVNNIYYYFSDGWIGIVRVCYHPGSLQGINETNGCKNWTNDVMGYTAHYCFCDTDYCNSSLINSGVVKVIMFLMLMIWIVG